MIATMPRALLQFIDDELLRAPLLFDQLVEATMAHAQQGLSSLGPLQRAAIADLIQALQAQRMRLSDYFVRSLQAQVQSEAGAPVLTPHAAAAAKADLASAKAVSLSLVDEDVVALDVELSHAIERIKGVAEYELRELQTFTSALVGDMDVARDHNPFRAETYARALWDAAQGLTLSRGHQVAFMRHAAMPLAQLLRKSYAGASSRLESMGIEPAAYRTLILPAGSRRGRLGENTFAPDLYRMRETMPALADNARPSDQGQQAGAARPAAVPPSTAPATGSTAARLALVPPREHWSDIARGTANRVDRQAIELVSRLFDAMMGDTRVPADVSLLVARLQGPAMRLTLQDGSLLDQDRHPLWRFINRVCFEAEMAPDARDPERLLLLKLVLDTVDRVAAEPEQHAGLYRWAMDRLESFLHKRMTRRLSAAASHIGALQKLEDKITAGHTEPSTLHGMLDVPQLDTVPAELLDAVPPPAAPGTGADEWLESLNLGDWVRLFLQGRWVHARLLWPGERREVWLFGDGASDATWAVRRGALLTMQRERLAKTLKQRSIVGSAAARVQEQMEQGQQGSGAVAA